MWSILSRRHLPCLCVCWILTIHHATITFSAVNRFSKLVSGLNVWKKVQVYNNSYMYYTFLDIGIMQRYLFQNLDTLIKYFLWRRRRRRGERVAWNWCLEESKIDSSNVAICTQFANPRDFGMNIRHHRNILSDGSTGSFFKVLQLISILEFHIWKCWTKLFCFISYYFFLNGMLQRHWGGK